VHLLLPRIEGEGPEGEVRPRPAPRTARRSSGTSASSTTRTVRFTSSSTSTRSPWLHPEYRTEPNVYYIPPYAPPQTSESGETVDANRIPRNYLEELFGPEVESALNTITREREKAERGEESELMEILSTVNNDDQYRLEVFDDDG